MKDFFISYNKADRTWAEWIAWHLEEEDYTVTIQAWDFRPGSNFILEMQRAAAEAERTVAVLSPDYLASRFTQPEWAAAFGQDPTGEKGTLLPVRVRDCDLEGLLPAVIYIDLVDLEELAARDALLAGVKRARAKPASAPAFPATRLVPQQPRFPGALPPVWNVPYPRNPNFTGRDQLLDDLREALTSGEPAACIQARHGLGGVGKTQLAVHYAYRHTADYDIVWWIRAEEPATLSADYAALAGPLGLPQGEAADESLAVNAVCDWLNRNTGWLLIFDDAPNRAAVRDYLPQGGDGHVLITSRYPAWRGVARARIVREFKRAQSVAFLQGRTGQEDDAAAKALAADLGDLPLALEQAAAYIDETGTTLAAYLDLFRDRRAELWEKEQPPEDYPETVGTSWTLAMDRVTGTPGAAGLLNLCAHLGPDEVPRDLLTTGAERVSPPLSEALADDLALNDAVAALRRYSLVEATGEGWTVHRLVAAVACDRLSGEERRTWAGAAIHIVNDAFPHDSDAVRTWPQCARLLPHALAAAACAEALDVAPEATARLLNQVGLYLHSRADYAGARAAYERALAIDEAAFGPDDPRAAIRVNNLGRVLQDLGDYEGARAAYERALTIDEAAFGPDHPSVAIRVNNLGSVLQDLGDYEGARAAYERALAIDEAAFGLDHPEVATDVNNLGLVLQDLGDNESARAAYERALAIDEAAFGPDHPEVAIDVNNLGGVLHALGDYKGARAAFQRALAIGEKTLGPDHPKVAIRVNNLGRVLHALGDLAGARAAYERALAILEHSLPPDHPYIAAARRSLDTVNEELASRS